MSILDLLLTVVVITAFCLGLRTLMSEGMILHWVREPFDRKHTPKWLKILMKPLVLCVICFSSVWGGSCFVVLHGLSLTLLPYLIVSCICAAFLIRIVNDKMDW